MDVDIAGSALENLVHQFANPLDFLRELVQNAVDAGSPEVVVRLVTIGREGGDALVRLSVEDAGSGMDERVIDGELTRLFASSKEDDLATIGRFGIGFVSVFAIRPEAVQVVTGRHGEAWELWFHPDRSFDKARLERPVHGTTVSVFKRLPDAAARRLVEDCRATLAYWCEHAETPVYLSTREPADDAVDLGERIGTTFGLAADPAVRAAADGTEVWVGYGEPRFSFYNGGLTLISTADPRALGDRADGLAHLAVKVRDRRLGYTVTRDNVLQDEAFERAMRVVAAAADGARGALIDRAEAACRAGEPLERWHRALAAESRVQGRRPVEGFAGWSTRWSAALAGRTLVRDHRGEPVRTGALRDQVSRFGTVVWTDRRLDAEVGAACEAAGVVVVQATEETRSFLGELGVGPAYGGGGWPLARLDEWFEWVEPIADVTEAERELVAAASKLASAAVGLRIAVAGRAVWWARSSAVLGGLARFRLRSAGPSDPVALVAAPTGGLVRRQPPGAGIVPRALRRRSVLIDRDHPLFRTLRATWAERPGPAALALAQLLLDAEGPAEEGRWNRLLSAWTATWEGR